MELILAGIGFGLAGVLFVIWLVTERVRSALGPPAASMGGSRSNTLTGTLADSAMLEIDSARTIGVNVIDSAHEAERGASIRAWGDR